MEASVGVPFQISVFKSGVEVKEVSVCRNCMRRLVVKISLIQSVAALSNGQSFECFVIHSSTG